MFDFNTDWLKVWAKYTPNRLFLREYNRDIKWSYSEFNKLTNAYANYLVNELRLVKGERIAVYSKNRAEYVLLFTACVKTGIILVPLNFRLTPRELDGLMADAEPTVFYYESEYKEQIKEIKSLVNVKSIFEIEDLEKYLTEPQTDVKFSPSEQSVEEDIVMILYTAGTTGVSKGVMITHKMLYWNAVNTALRLDLTTTDHTQSYAPFFHTGGWNVLFTPFLHHGASHTLLQSFDAGIILKLIEEEKATIIFGVPTMLKMMSDHPDFEKTDLSSVRYAIVGGAPMPIPLINLWHSKGVFIRQGYGLTEVGPNCFSLHQDDAIRKKGSIGFPNFYVETKIMGEEGVEVGANEIGELWMRSPIVTPGYWRKPKETADTITDGWFHTGDLVKRDEEEYFYVVDRKKNMFISGGENVYPAEIERYFYTNDKISECAVFGVPDEKWGEVGKVVVSLKPGNEATAIEFIEFCKGNLAKYKIPKYAEVLPELPKNAAGKIDKRVLLENHLNTINQ